MITYEDECVGCPEGMGCFGDSCPQKNVLHQYCDKCDEECESLREYNGEQWCDNCILCEYELVKIDD